MAKTCKYCKKPHKAKGLCQTHYRRLQRHGNPKIVKPKGYFRVVEKTICQIDDCKNYATSKGICEQHRGRIRRHGSPHIVKNNRGQGFALHRGYKIISVNGKYKAQHRLVAEQFLGRKLESWEVVHHKDGNRANNDPSNLVVMTNVDHSKHHHTKHKRGN